MTKIDGHAFYDQNFGHGQFGISTSDPTWQILHGGHVTKPNVRGSKLAQFISPMYMGQAQQFLGSGLFTSDFFSLWHFYSPFPSWALAFYESDPFLGLVLVNYWVQRFLFNFPISVFTVR
jgi:hypothetical protein